MTLLDASTHTLLWIILGMILLSAFFSSAETAMMALNRYRLRHLALEKQRGAVRASRLLERPDRLLGVILLGNNLVNFMAASLATVIGLRLLGDLGVALAPVVVTIVFLIFAEVAPKTIAAQFPERIAFPASFILGPLLRIMYPLVWVLNTVSNMALLPWRHSSEHPARDRLTAEELRTMLYDSSALSSQRQNMMLGVLDLERVTVEDIMVPRQEIIGIDLLDDFDVIAKQLRQAQYTRLPVYRENINNIQGVLHLRYAARYLTLEAPNRAELMQLARQPYFIPECAPLHQQLLEFQKQRERFGLVVDEYGDVKGIVTLDDILEEIVGDFTTAFNTSPEGIHSRADGSWYIDGSALLRDINRVLQWSLPTGGPKTLNGLFLEHLEMIPEANVCLQIGDYRFETLRIRDNAVTTIRATVAEAASPRPGD